MSRNTKGVDGRVLWNISLRKAPPLPHRKAIKASKSIRSRLLLAVSVGALTTMMPGIYGGYGNRGRAMALPTGCTDAGGGTTAEAGETITCLSPPNTISRIDESADDLTINIGDATTPTNVAELSANDHFAAVTMTGGGALTLNVENADSSIYTYFKHAVDIQTSVAGTGVTITSAGTLKSGNYSAIYVRNNGTGAITIDTAGDMRSLDTATIDVENAAGGTDISITNSAKLRGVANNAITVKNNGTGATTINVNEIVAYGTAILARNTVSGADITITATGALTSSNHTGIIAEAYGVGDIIVDVDDITSKKFGMSLLQEGNGGVTVSATTVTSTNSTAISVINAAASTDISITTTGAVTAKNDGIYVRNNGTGSTSIIATDITTTNNDGIDVVNAATTIDLTITATGSVSADDKGIVAVNNGSGLTSITVNDVSSNSTDAIEVDTAASTTDLTVTSTGSLYGGGAYGNGIDVTHNGSGLATISVNNVTSAALGMLIHTSSQSTGLSITAAGTIAAEQQGVYAYHKGSGAVNVSVANVDANGGYFPYIYYGGGAVSILNTSSGSDINVTATGTVTSGSYSGIYVLNEGSGATTITAASVSAKGYGIYASNSGSTTDLSITVTGTVSGRTDSGIRALNGGTGNTTITANNVNGGVGPAIYARNKSAAADLSVTTTGTVKGTNGIVVSNQGTGTTSVTVNDVDTARKAIVVETAATAAGVAVTVTGVIKSDDDAIGITHNGGGGVVVSVTDVTSQQAISVTNSANGSDIDITATGTLTTGPSAADASNFGIKTDNQGTGSTTIVTVAVSTAGGTGIKAYAAIGTTDVSITTTGAVAGGYYGIYAVSAGSGAMSITAGDVTGTNGAAIYADLSPNGTSLSITTTGTVSSDERGIDARTYGSGALTVTNTGDVSGGYYGAYISNYGSGTTTVSLVNVTATVSDGLSFVAGGTSGDATITVTGTATGGDDGVDLVNEGTGSMFVIIANAIGDDDGIDIENLSGDVTVTVTGTVVGVDTGITLDSSVATGSTTITVSGDVTGTTDTGIYTATSNGTDITVTSSGTVTGVNAAIDTASYGTAGLAVDDTVTLMIGATLNGSTFLNAGADTVNDAGATFTAIYGGAGTDTLNFTGTSRTINGPGATDNAVQGFEIFNFNADGIILSGDHIGLEEANFNVGTTTLTGTLAASEIFIALGAELAASDGTSFTGNLINAGTFTIGNSPGTSTINGDFTQTATGTLPIEIEGSAFDQLIVTGDVTLDGSLEVSISGAIDVGTTTRRIIDGAGTLSGTFSSVSGSDGLLIFNAVTLDTGASDVFLTTTVRTASSLGTLTPNQAAVGDNLIGQLADPTINAGLLALATAIGVTADPTLLAARLHELGPEVADLGLKYLAQSQNRFAMQMFDASAKSTPDLNKAHIWGTVQAYVLTQDGGDNYTDFDGTAFELMVGVSSIGVSEEYNSLSLGVAAGYGHFTGDTPNGAGGVLGDNAEASVFHAGASLGFDISPFESIDAHIENALSISVGQQSIDMNLVDLTSSTRIKQSAKVDFRSLNWSAQITFDGAGESAWPVQPFLHVGMSKTWQDGFSLDSGTASSLVVDEFESLKGMVGVGASLTRQIGEATEISARVAGYQFFGDTQNVFDTRFASAPSGAAFQTAGKEMDQQVRFDGAMTHRFKNNIDLKANVFGEVGGLSSLGGGLTLSMHF